MATLLPRELDARETLPELRTAPGDMDPGVRLQAALALGAMRDTEARGRLEAALETEQFSDVRQALAGALKALVPPLSAEGGRRSAATEYLPQALI